jgi:hypothetical protein
MKNQKEKDSFAPAQMDILSGNKSRRSAKTYQRAKVKVRKSKVHNDE